MSLSLKLIQGDIFIAKFCLSSIANWFNDESLYSYAAYHTQQATEKCLKVVLNQYYGVSETTKRFRTHNISALLDYIMECETDSGKTVPIAIPSEIDVNSILITSWEANARYNDNMVLLRNKISLIIKACDIMYKELREKGFQ